MPKRKSSSSEIGTVLAGGTRKRRTRKAPFPMPKAGHVAGTDRWEVEEIVDYRLSPAIHSPNDAEPNAKRMVYFVVKWAHYDEDELTLEGAINLLSSLNLVTKFLKTKGFSLEMNLETEESWLVPLEKTN